MLNLSAGCDAEVPVVTPGGGHRGAEGCRTAGEVVSAVAQLKVAADNRHGIAADISAAVIGCDRAVGIDSQPLGTRGDGDLIGVGGELLFLCIDQIPVADEQVGGLGVVWFMKLR